MTVNEVYDALIDRSIRVGECLIYPDGVGRYGKLFGVGEGKYVHRLMYEAVHGPIPEGHVVDHICFHTRCVEPLHLRALTVSGNGLNRRGAASHSKTGIRGVSRVRGRATTPWMAKVTLMGYMYKEYYATKEEAAVAVEEMRRRLGAVL